MVIYHLVNSLNNSQHLVIANLSIPINIIKLERPIELIFHLPSARDAQSAYELFEIDGPGFIAIEDIEDVICEGGWIAEREELSVDFLEFVFGERAGWTIFQKA